MSARDKTIRTVKRVAAVLAAVVAVIGYLILDARTTEQGRFIEADACSKGREDTVACRAQTCRQLRAVVRDRSRDEIRELLNCTRIEAAARRGQGAEPVPAALGRAPSSGSSRGPSAAQPSPGGQGGQRPGPSPNPGRPNPPAPSPGGGGGGQAPGNGPPVHVQTPDLPIVGKPSVCVPGLGVGLNC